jgi:DivIVA domain-containing protein
VTYDDTSGLDLFDENASAVGNFPQALRGYDKGAVDAYVRDVEAQLSRAKAQLRQQQKQLATAAAKSDDTDLSKLGAHARGMLRSAEAQANELLTSAQNKAKAIIADAEFDAARRHEEAQAAVEANRVASADNITELRKQLADQNAADLQGVKDQAAFVREAAAREASQIVEEAKARAKLIADQNATECQARVAEAERQAAEHQAELLRLKETDLAALKASQEEAATTLNTLVDESRKRAEEFRTQLESETETWEQRRAAVQAEADEIRRSAAAEAEALLKGAKVEAKNIHAEGIRIAEDRKSKLEAKVELLSGRHKAILAQLNELSSLAGRSVAEYADEDGSSAPAATQAESPDSPDSPASPASPAEVEAETLPTGEETVALTGTKPEGPQS